MMIVEVSWPFGQTRMWDEVGMSAKNILDRGVARHYSEVGHGEANVTKYLSDRPGKEVLTR